MSVIGLEVKWRIGSESGPDVLQRCGVAFERAGTELVDMGKHVFPLLPSIFEAAEQRQFDAEGAGPVAGSWAALSETYAAWKAKKYPGQPILVATGALRDALTKPNSPLGARDWSATTFVFGTQGVEYASYHQLGTTSEASGGMPARPPFDLDEQFQDELDQAVRDGVLASVAEGMGNMADSILDEGGVRRDVLTGSRGGRYYINSGGNRTYV